MVQIIDKIKLFDSSFEAKVYGVFLDEYRYINARG